MGQAIGAIAGRGGENFLQCLDVVAGGQQVALEEIGRLLPLTRPFTIRQIEHDQRIARIGGHSGVAPR